MLAEFEKEIPEPEPPAGLRAPQDTERYRRAHEAYLKALEDWATARRRRMERVAAGCTDHLRRFPDEKRAEVLFLRGVARFELNDLKGARGDLEEALRDGKREPARVGALVAVCRAMGDYRAALRHHGGEDPDLLEEAGRVARAIRAAEAAGRREQAARWRLIGKKFPGSVQIPAGARAAIVSAERDLAPERMAAIKKRYGDQKVAFLTAKASYPAVYLLDAGGLVRAVDPRPDTWEHRLDQLLKAD